MTGKHLIAGTVPEGALALHVIILGKTRSGKSSKARLIVEHCLEQGQPVGIIDPKGDWWGIKLSASGKSAGFPVVIFGGEHADVKINEHSGAVVAEIVAAGNRPFLIDLGGWMPAKRTRFFVDFASTFFLKTRGKRVLMIDEVHNFAPQGKVLDPESGRALHWANRLASEGGGKGITLISASQRPQKVHKDYVTSHETLIACKVIHKLDRDAVKDWIDGCGDPEQGREVFKTLGSLPKPQAWVWSPEIQFGPSLVTFPMFKTYDSFKPQEEGDAAKLKGWASVDLEEVNQKLAEVIAEETAKDPVKLRADLAKASARIAELEKAKPAAAPAPADLEAAEKRGFERANKAMVAGMEREMKAAIVRVIEELKADVDRLAAKLAADLKAIKPMKLASEQTFTPAADSNVQKVQIAPRNPMPKITKAAAEGDRPLGAERKPLAALAAVYPSGMTESQWRVSAGFKQSGTWSTYLGRLRGAGRIEQRDGLFFATEAGIADLGENVPTMPPPGRQLVDFWVSKISGVGPILRRLSDIYPEWRTRADLADDVGLVPTSGTFSTYLGRLKSPGLIEYGPDKQVRASRQIMEG